MSQTKTNSPEWRYEGFGQNFLVAEEEHSLSCRNTQYWGRPKRRKLNRNGSRMDDMRNRDRENDRTGPRSIFRPLPQPKTIKKRSKIVKNPVWGPSLGLLLQIRSYQRPISSAGGAQSARERQTRAAYLGRGADVRS